MQKIKKKKKKKKIYTLLLYTDSYQSSDSTQQQPATAAGLGTTGIIPAATHSEHRFPAPSSKLCQIWLRY